MRGIAFLLICLMIGAALPPLAEGRGVSKLSIALFALGIASKFGSAYAAKLANESYDAYLHTAVQSEMQKKLDEYRLRRDVSRGLSAASIGFTAIGAICSFYKALSPPPERPVSIHIRRRGDEVALSLKVRF